jgi:2-keto-4-pentenoate hydratase/2-oxohepta-3-ene-1,7-dioic acid hydratase in catechol pathway
MKIATLLHQTSFGELKRLSLQINNNEFIDVNLVWRKYFEVEGYFSAEDRANRVYPSSLYEFLKTHTNPLEVLQNTIGIYFKLKQDGVDIKAIHLSNTTHLSNPMDKIHMYRDFFAHEKHVKVGFEKRNEKVPEAWYEIPAFYKGSVNGFIGPEEEIIWPSYTDKLDYELELAMVLSRDGKNIKAKDFHKYALGFTILNDISARDIQKKEMSIRLGPSKGKDFCSVLGPVIVTIDEFNNTDPKLLMTAKINGTEWSRGNSGDSHYSWGEMLEFLSKDEWVCSSDVLGSGTVGTGCGLEIDKWIKPGDIVELEIEKIGILKNKVGSKLSEK